MDGSLGPDRRQPLEVVVGRRRGRGPLERVAAPRVGRGRRGTAQGERDRGQEGQDPDRQQERTDGRELVEPLPAGGGGVVGDPPGHPHGAQLVLGHEGQPEADDPGRGVDPAEPLGQEPAGHLGEPEVDPGEQREDRPADQDVVEVGDHEVGVLGAEVDRRRGEHDPADPAEGEYVDHPDRPDHRRREAQVAAPHRGDPVEDLDSGRDRDEQRGQREEGQVDRTGREHVVGPHAHRQRPDGDHREDHEPVAEEGLAREDRDHLADDPEVGQDQDVDLRVAEEPEQVLPQDRAAAQRRVEEGAAEVAVDEQEGEADGDRRECEQDEDRRHEDAPGEHRHPEHAHPGRPATVDRGQEVDRAEDPGDSDEGDPRRSTGPGPVPAGTSSRRAAHNRSTRPPPPRSRSGTRPA